MSTMSPLNDAPKPRIPDAIDKQRLQAMQLVAKMKESADKYGVGFVGGFVSPDGQKFMMTNMTKMTPMHSYLKTLNKFISNQ
jgi:selenophosphate synthetase-related protein